MKTKDKTIGEVVQMMTIQIRGLLNEGDLKAAINRSEDLTRFIAAIGVGLSESYSEDEALFMEKAASIIHEKLRDNYEV